MFASHPPPDERKEVLGRLAQESAGGVSNEPAWREHVKPYLREWLNEEVKRAQHEESLALLTRMIGRSPAEPDYTFARGEVYRLRAKGSDHDAAIADYQAAVAVGGEPPETHRGLGTIYRLRRRPLEATASYRRYLDLAPDAPDSAMIKSYLEELRT
jgi:tetratricopeptide (TPR) repeat protein